MNTIIKQIGKIVKNKNWEQLGRVKVVQHDDLILLDYKSSCQYDGNWTPYELACRGLIFNTEGEIVALPFPKFFNYGERLSTEPIKSVTKKMDGSLGILYRHKGQFKVATRGSFTSPQALFATNELSKYNLQNLPYYITLLFEIIYPENRVVVNYKDYEGLILIGATDYKNDTIYDYGTIKNLADYLGLQVTESVPFKTVNEILKAVKPLTGEEGYVALFENGQMLKFKSDWYLQHHKIKSNFGYSYILELLQKGMTLEDLPDEFYEEARLIALEIDNKYMAIINEAHRFMIEHSRIAVEDRKQFALMAKDHPLKGIMFCILDKKDEKKLVFKMLWDEYREGKRGG